MAHPDAKPIIDGEVDSHLEHLRFINDEVGPRFSAASSPLSTLHAMLDHCINAWVYVNFHFLL